MEVADREQVGLSCLKPCSRGGTLARGTVPGCGTLKGNPPVSALGAGLKVRGGKALLDRRRPQPAGGERSEPGPRLGSITSGAGKTLRIGTSPSRCSDASAHTCACRRARNCASSCVWLRFAQAKDTVFCRFCRGGVNWFGIPYPRPSTLSRTRPAGWRRSRRARPAHSRPPSPPPRASPPPRCRAPAPGSRRSPARNG